MSTAVCPARGATLGGPHPAGRAPLPAPQPAPGDGGRASPPVPRPLRGQCGGCGCGGRQPAPSDVPTERVRPAHPGSLVFPWPPSTRGQCPGPGCPPRRQRRGLVPHLSSPGGGDPACSPRGRFCRAAALGQWQPASPSPSFLRPRRGRTPGRASVGPRRPGLRGRACRGALVPSPPSEEAPGEPRTGGVAAWPAALWPAHEATPPQTLGRRATSHCPVHEHLTFSCTQQFKRSWCLSLSVRRCPPCPERLPWALTGTPGAASGAAQEAAALR